MPGEFYLQPPTNYHFTPAQNHDGLFGYLYFMQDYQKQLVLNLLAYAVQKNIPLEQLCAHSGIELSALKKEGNSPLTPEQINDVWINATELSQDSLFGLHFGESLQLVALGVVGELIRHSRTIGEALTQAVMFGHLITDALEMDINHFDQTFSIRFIPDAASLLENPVLMRQMMDFFMAFTLHEVDGLVLEKISPIGVKLPFTEENRAEYQRIFRCQSLCSEPDEYVMAFDNRYWDEPILTADYDLQSVFLRKVSTLNDAFRQTQNLSKRITTYLLANAYLGIPALDSVAANLNISSRSLQRKLQQEGITYQQLVDSIRKSLAIHYLTSGQYPVKEVSYILGYNELSAFNRAFRRWTGTTPVSYQRGQYLPYNEIA